MSSIEKTIIFIFFITIVIPSSIVHACTGFYVVDKAGTILAGKNEDYFNPNTKMWFVPSENGKYGKVYFGFDDYFPQGGMNEKGLFFDAFATEPLEVVNSGDKPFYMGNLTDKVMSECSTIEEVIEVYKTYNLKFLRNANLFFGDSKGNSVIIEGDDFIVKQGNYQISTNFHQSRIKPNEITCWRYLKADEMLKPIPNISVSLSRSILQAVHVHVTLYSNIYDLKKKKLYLYHFHDFDNVIEIDLLNELKKGEQSFDIPNLFPKNNYFDEFKKEYKPKLTPLNSRLLYLFFLLCGILFLVSPIVFLGGYIINRKKKTKDKSSNRFYAIALVIGSITCVITLLFLLGLSEHPISFNQGFPIIRDLSLPLIVIFFLHIPLLNIPLILVMMSLLLLAIRNKLWTKFIRVYYTIIVLILITNLSFFSYWGLLRVSLIFQ